MICPSHQVALQRSRTRWGGRWGCPVPECTVVCWEGSTSLPADAETRDLRYRCHQAFDPLWKRGDRFCRRMFPGNEIAPTNAKIRRSMAYSWLAGAMGVPIEKAHFGMFDADQCRKALAAIEKLIQQEATHA